MDVLIVRKIRARVEHVFGNQHNSMGGKLVRTIGIVRATVKIGMQNLAYNMRRLVVLEHAALAGGYAVNEQSGGR